MSEGLTRSFADLSFTDLSLEVIRVEAQLALAQAMVPAGAAGGPVLDELAPQALLPPPGTCLEQALCKHDQQFSDCDDCRLAKFDQLLAAETQAKLLDMQKQIQDLQKLQRAQADACQRMQLMSTDAKQAVVCTWIEKAPKVGSVLTSSVAQVAAQQESFRASEAFLAEQLHRHREGMRRRIFDDWRIIASSQLEEQQKDHQNNESRIEQLSQQVQQQQKLLEDMVQQAEASKIPKLSFLLVCLAIFIMLQVDCHGMLAVCKHGMLAVCKHFFAVREQPAYCTTLVPGAAKLHLQWVNKVYRRRCLEVHPDKRQGDEARANEEFLELRNEYEAIRERALQAVEAEALCNFEEPIARSPTVCLTEQECDFGKPL
jgi:hypothetical protein